jgi:hypothetical protein
LIAFIFFLELFEFVLISFFSCLFDCLQLSNDVFLLLLDFLLLELVFFVFVIILGMEVDILIVFIGRSKFL